MSHHLANYYHQSFPKVATSLRAADTPICSHSNTNSLLCAELLNSFLSKLPSRAFDFSFDRKSMGSGQSGHYRYHCLHSDLASSIHLQFLPPSLFSHNWLIVHYATRLLISTFGNLSCYFRHHHSSLRFASINCSLEDFASFSKISRQFTLLVLNNYFLYYFFGFPS